MVGPPDCERDRIFRKSQLEFQRPAPAGPDYQGGFIASVRAGAARHCRARPASPHSGAVVRDFKKQAFPMAEEKWSVAVASPIELLSPEVASAKIQIIVTRERTS
jgi:hypothetical protein